MGKQTVCLRNQVEASVAMDRLSHEGHEIASGQIIQELVAMQKSLNFIQWEWGNYWSVKTKWLIQSCGIRSVVSNSLRCPGLYSPWNSLGQNTGVGSLSLLQGIFLTQGSNLGLPHWRQILYQLSHSGSWYGLDDCKKLLWHQSEKIWGGWGNTTSVVSKSWAGEIKSAMRGYWRVS